MSAITYPRTNNMHVPIQCLSFSNSARLGALGCSNHIKIVKIDNSNFVSDYANFSSLPMNSVITDMSWSKTEPMKLAVSFTTGTIMCLNINESVNKPGGVSQEWNSGKISSGVNKIAWHPTEKNIIASANQDGLVKLFDFRYSNNPCQVTPYGHRSSIVSRDVSFDPFHTDIFAEVSDSGNLKLWDRRFIEKPFMMKAAAHSQPILSVAWHPSVEYVLATGSRDKNVKVWDYSVCSVDSATSHHSMEGSEPVLLRTLHTSAAVDKVSWRSSDDQHRNHLATISAHSVSGHGSAAVNPDANGNVSVWDLDHPNIPIAILKGHDVSDCCVDFLWLDSLSAPESGGGSEKASGAVSATSKLKKASSKSNNFANYQKNLEVQQQKAQQQSQQAVTQYILSVSSGKEGKLLVQDMRRLNSSAGAVFYPYDHISPSVVAISSQGHAAFHKGVINDDVRSVGGALPVILSGVAAGSGAKDSKGNTSKGGARNSNSSSGIGQQLSTSQPHLSGSIGSGHRSGSFKYLDALHTGSVAIGLAKFENLEESNGIRNERGAEGGVFDPALIHLLARHYSLAHTMYGSEEATTRLREGSCSSSAAYDEHKDREETLTRSRKPSVEQAPSNFETHLKEQLEFQERQQQEAFLLKKMRYEEAMEACRINLKVAQAAGLKCRASVWFSLTALMPIPQPPAPIKAPTAGSCNTSTNSAVSESKEPDELTLSKTESQTAVPDLLQQLIGSIDGNNAHLRQELPFAVDVIASLVNELLEGGDSQHFVVVCEILRKAGIFEAVCAQGQIVEFRVRRTYLAYLDLLGKLQLFCEANEIIKASSDSYISSLSKQGVEIHTRCAKCGKELTEKSSTGWCVKCARCVCMCVLCNRPVRGLLHWCPVCGHGGHLECTQKWFKLFNTCPSGCGHDCCSALMPNLCVETAAAETAAGHANRIQRHMPSNSSRVGSSDKDSVDSPRSQPSSVSFANKHR